MATLNFKAIAESANVVLTTSDNRKALNNANREYNSLSSVLKYIQRKNLMSAGYKVLFGLPTTGVIAPKEFLSRISPDLFVEVTHGRGAKKTTTKVVGIIARRTDKEKNAYYKVCKVTSWTPRKLFLMVEQSNLIEAVKAAKAASK